MSIHTAMMDNHTACLIQNSRMPIQDAGIPELNTAILGQYDYIMNIYTVMMDKHTACQEKDTELHNEHTPYLIMFTTLLNLSNTHSSILGANNSVLWVMREYTVLLTLHNMI